MKPSLVFSMGCGGLQGHPRQFVHRVTACSSEGWQGHSGTGAGHRVLPCSGAALCSPVQAGGKHYHPTCARCVRCHQMFTEGEEMYLTGRAVTSVAVGGSCWGEWGVQVLMALGMVSLCSSARDPPLHCSPDPGLFLSAAKIIYFHEIFPATELGTFCLPAHLGKAQFLLIPAQRMEMLGCPKLSVTPV